MDYNQKFQQEAFAQANNMITKMLCEEKGIDYNSLMQQAQVSQFEAILEQQELRQIDATVRAHYQGEDNSFFGKFRTALTGQGQQQEAPSQFAQGMLQYKKQQQEQFSPQALAESLGFGNAPSFEEEESDDGPTVSELENRINSLEALLSEARSS